MEQVYSICYATDLDYQLDSVTDQLDLSDRPASLTTL